MHSFYFDLFGHMGLGPHGKELLLYLKQTIIYLHQDKQGLSFTVLAVPCLVCIWLLDFQAKSISDEMQRQCRCLISLHRTSIKLGSIIIQSGSCNILTGETNADTGHIGSFNVAQPM